jgi:hypothetical protein
MIIMSNIVGIFANKILNMQKMIVFINSDNVLII